jgi:hypothetical protein
MELKQCFCNLPAGPFFSDNGEGRVAGAGGRAQDTKRVEEKLNHRTLAGKARPVGVLEIWKVHTTALVGACCVTSREDVRM